MQIDATNFPLVWTQFKAPNDTPGASPLDEFEALLKRQKIFVFLNDEGLNESSHDHSPEEMKQTSLWMKRHKSELRTFVKAAIFIEPDEARRQTTQKFAANYEKFWGYPMLMVPGQDQAVELAQDLLQMAR